MHVCVFVGLWLFGYFLSVRLFVHACVGELRWVVWLSNHVVTLLEVLGCFCVLVASLGCESLCVCMCVSAWLFVCVCVCLLVGMVV